MMALKPLLREACLSRIPYLQLPLERCIKTDSNQRKGKISVVKKKFIPEEKSFEILEVKDSSSVMKKLNWENNKLFGDILSAAQRYYYKTYETFSVKNMPKSVPKYSKKCPEMVDEDSAIPVKNVKTVLNPLETSSIPLVSNKALSKKETLSLILDFPLSNSLPKQANNDYVDKLNYLREYLSSLCNSGTFPSVTTILEKTMPPERDAVLAKWKSNMISKMGLENFEQYQQELLASGSALHNTISMHLSGVPESKLPIEEAISGYWTSLKDVLPEVKDVRFLEEHVSHQFLCYRGVADCFGRYKDKFAVIDWKTSRKLKPTLHSTFDSPLQVAAYVGAVNFDQNWSYLANTGLIVIAYNNGRPASIHYIDEQTLLKYWNLWLIRVKSYWENFNVSIQPELLDHDELSECLDSENLPQDELLRQ